MVKAVFIQNPSSNYDDRPGVAYHFPRRYLGTVQQTVGDWVVFYEGRKGAFGYIAVQKVRAVRPDPNRPDHFYADLDPASAWDFENIVARNGADGRAFETSLRGPDGRAMSGGASVSAVRRLSELEFAAIVQTGLAAAEDANAMPRRESAGFSEEQSVFEQLQFDAARESVLVSRKLRDASFARTVKAAYDGRCAMSGLSLRNGGGRPEVEAAHIVPVKDGGSDQVRNGLALSGTLHWMFDRGLLSVAEDHSILISHNKVPRDVVDRLIVPDRKLVLPNQARHHPHAEYLRYHRENVFGQVH